MASSLSARIPRKLLDEGGPALAAHVAANLERLVADVVAAGRKTRALELAEALRRHADDPGLARAAAELGEFTGGSRFAGTGLVAAFARAAARGFLTEPDPATRLSTLKRLTDWTTSSGEFGAAADVQELVVAERRAEGGPRFFGSLVASMRLMAMATRREGGGKAPTWVTARVDEILDLAASRAAEERLPVAELLKSARSAVTAFQSMQGGEAAVDPSARLVELAKDWCAPNDPALLPLVEKIMDDHITRLLALDRLDDAIGYSRQVMDRYGLLAVTSRDVDPAHAAIVADRHAHFLDRAERAEEALSVSERAIALGAKAAPHFPRFAGLLRFHADRLLAVGRESEAIEVARRAVEAGEQADSPLETAFSLGDLVVKLSNADRDDEALEWTRRAVTAWRELLDEGIEIAPRNLALALANQRAVQHRAGRHNEAR